MNHAAKPRIDVDQLMERVREEARRRRDVAANGTRPNLYLDSPDREARSSSRSNRIQVKDEYALAEFLHYPDEDFLRNAYIALLRRAPDAGGYEHYLHALRAGAMNKVDVLARLRYSAEGRAKAVHVSRLRIAAIYRKLRVVPVLGYVLTWTNHLLRLPRLARSEERTRSALDAIESRLAGIEQRLAVLSGQLEQTESLSEQASSLSAVAAELAEAALVVADHREPPADAG